MRISMAKTQQRFVDGEQSVREKRSEVNKVKLVQQNKCNEA